MTAHYYDELLKYFARVMQDYDAAADIVQEAYARLLALQQAGQHVTESRALLYRIARNLVIDRYRRGQVQGWTTDNHSLENFPAQRACEPDALVASSQVLQAVLTTIDALPLRCREAFILHRFDGLSHAEVAELWEFRVRRLSSISSMPCRRSDAVACKWKEILILRLLPCNAEKTDVINRY